MMRKFALLVVGVGVLGWIGLSAQTTEATLTPIVAVGPCTFLDTPAGANVTMTGLGPCDIGYTSDAGEETLVEAILNATGVAWHDFHLEVGFGLGPAFVHVAPIHFGELVSLSGFTLVGQDPVPDPNTLDFVATGPDIPSGALTNLSAEVYPGGVIVETFTLRRIATIVPAPATLALLGLGLLLAGLGRPRA
jgi:hypothetical protein